MSLFEPYQPIAAIAPLPIATKMLQPLCRSIGADLYVKAGEERERGVEGEDGVKFYNGSLKDHIAAIWAEYRALIFCLATGAVIRLIAPLLQDKSSDPAIVVIDPKGQYVISLCSGHQGNADRLTQLIAHQLEAIPVITSASTSLDLPGIDILGLPFGWRKGSGDWTGVSSAIARGELVQVIQEAGSILWQDNLPEKHPFYFGFPEVKESITPKSRIWISATKRQFSPHADFPKVQWHPRVLWVGVGCIRGTTKQLIETAIQQVCQRNHLATEAIAGLATIDIKADERGLLDYCKEHQLPLKTYAAESLRSVTVPTPSDTVALEVGTPSVAEAAALLAVGKQGKLLVSKQVIERTATIAIAQSEQEYIGRTGQLLLIGTGPGSIDQITSAAKSAIAQADVIIGYSLYIELIRSLLRPGQIIEALPITQEQKRARRAIDLAQWGLTVAVVSSGDCGIYGMAGLVLETLRSLGWDGIPKVQVFPGITALQAAAARVGAPLMHDFCAISLSDLLTPWEVIEKRLQAAAVGDFATAIYNPRSQTRTQQITTAQTIFLQYRDPQTPVAIVRCAYRQEEEITLTTLEKMLQYPIDMLTTIIIGNSSTRSHAGWMITPRGYNQ